MRRLKLGLSALCLALAAPEAGHAGRLDVFSNGGMPGPSYVVRRVPLGFLMPRFDGQPRRSRIAKRRPAAPIVKVESPTYYDFQPEALAPVDFKPLKSLSQAAKGDQGAP